MPEGFNNNLNNLKDLFAKARGSLRDYEISRLGTGVVRIFAVVGFVAVLAGGTWGAVQAVRFAPNTLSSLGAAAVSLSSFFIPAERLAISLEKAEIASGDEILVSWTHENPSGDGSYALSYACVEGVSISSPGADGKLAPAFCETPFNFMNTDSIRIAVTSDAAKVAAVPLTLSFTKTGSDIPSMTGNATLAVMNENTVDAVTAETPAETSSEAPVAAAPKVREAGTRTSSTHALGMSTPVSPTGTGVDLAARILETGMIDTTTNTFTATSSVRVSATVRPAVRFVIENLGTAASGPWRFNAALPTLPAHVFESDAQKSLGGNDRIEFTLGFDSVHPDEDGTAVFTVIADPSGSIKEVSEENNIAKATLTILL